MVLTEELYDVVYLELNVIISVFVVAGKPKT